MYEVCEEECVNEKGTYYTYGIKCESNEIYIPDITCNKEKLLSFVNILNGERLEPVHLFDVIEDNINELI